MCQIDCQTRNILHFFLVAGIQPEVGRKIGVEGHQLVRELERSLERSFPAAEVSRKYQFPGERISFYPFVGLIRERLRKRSTATAPCRDFALSMRFVFRSQGANLE